MTSFLSKMWKKKAIFHQDSGQTWAVLLSLYFWADGVVSLNRVSLSETRFDFSGVAPKESAQAVTRAPTHTSSAPARR